MSDPADVVQGRLGWEAGDISQATVANLDPHPKNSEIYGDTDDLEDTFVESISEKGVLEPLVITSDKQVVSGHRRLKAARQVGIESVPVRISEFDTDLAEREALIEFNRQREKTPGQIVNEFEEMLEIEKKKGKENQGERTDLSQDSEKGSDKHDSWEEASESFDVSKDTLSKGKQVKDKAESDDEPDEVQEAAQEAWDGLQSGDKSFNSAHQQVKTAENKAEKQQERKERTESFHESVADAEAVTVYECSAAELAAKIDSESVDHIITDPPYDADAVDDWAELAELAADILKPSGLLVAYSGKYHLPAVHQALGNDLEYFWQFIVRHTGSGGRIWPRNVRTNYKPVLVYAKPPVEKLDALAHDVIEGSGREKDDHEWQQATGEAIELVDQLTEPNDKICDPMCGSGTTGVAAVEQNRQVVLADRDSDAVETAKQRVYDVL